MNIFLIILGITLIVLFFLNFKSAVDVLCRIICGFIVLAFYNTVAATVGTVSVAINLISSFIVGIFGVPGSLMLLVATIFL